jgi:hypothetical protein
MAFTHSQKASGPFLRQLIPVRVNSEARFYRLLQVLMRKIITIDRVELFYVLP